MIQKDGSKEEAGEIFKSLVPEGWEEEAAGSPTPLQGRAFPRVFWQWIVL